MNKRIIITQRPDLISERAFSNHHTNRLPSSREKDGLKQTDSWGVYQSGIFSHRHRA
jgi:hypothetical protein